MTMSTTFFRWLTHTHAMRSITHRNVIGMGPLYQGRFKSLPVERDEHLATLLRYVERNPLQRWTGEAGFAVAMERKTSARPERGQTKLAAILSDWPIDRPANWERWVNEPQTEAEIQAVRECHSSQSPVWRTRVDTAGGRKAGFAMDSCRPRGRPTTKKTTLKRASPRPL